MAVRIQLTDPIQVTPTNDHLSRVHDLLANNYPLDPSREHELDHTGHKVEFARHFQLITSIGSIGLGLVLSIGLVLAAGAVAAKHEYPLGSPSERSNFSWGQNWKEFYFEFLRLFPFFWGLTLG